MALVGEVKILALPGEVVGDRLRLEREDHFECGAEFAFAIRSARAEAKSPEEKPYKWSIIISRN